MKTSKSKLILICGLPGAGKTTLAKKLSKELRAIRFCPDEWMEDMGISLWDSKVRNTLENRFWSLTQLLLTHDNVVILEYGFWGKSERDEKLFVARKLHARVELHYLDVPMKDLRVRLEKRGMEGDDLILTEKLEGYYSNFERPNEEELSQYDNYKDSESVN